jgi:hypothetical protein
LAEQRRPVERFDVELERDDERHSGTYSVEGGIVTVTYRGRTTSAQLGGSRDAPEHLAQNLLGELVSQAKQGR